MDENPREMASYDNSSSVRDIYETDAIHKGQIEITSLDKVKRIIQGTFYFKAYNSYRNDSVSITDGKFRLNYTIN